MSIRLVKAFVQLRKAISSNAQLQLEIEKIKNYIGYQNKKQENQEKNIDLLFQYVDRLQEKLESPPLKERKKKPLKTQPIP